MEAPPQPKRGTDITEAGLRNLNGSKKLKKKKAKSKVNKENKFKMAYTNRRITRQMSRSGHTELSKAEISCLSDEEKLQLTSWGLPASVIAVRVSD